MWIVKVLQPFWQTISVLLYSYWERAFPHGSTEISCAASRAHSILSKLPWRWPKVSSYPHVSVLLHRCYSLCFPRCQLSVNGAEIKRDPRLDEWIHDCWVKPSSFHLLGLSVSTPARCLQECFTDALRHHHQAWMEQYKTESMKTKLSNMISLPGQ